MSIVTQLKKFSGFYEEAIGYPPTLHSFVHAQDTKYRAFVVLQPAF